MGKGGQRAQTSRYKISNGNVMYTVVKKIINNNKLRKTRIQKKDVITSFKYCRLEQNVYKPTNL